MIYFDRFDICDAFALFEINFHIGGIDSRARARYAKRTGQPVGQQSYEGRGPRLESTGCQLSRLKYRNLNLTYETMTENAQSIYNDLVNKYEGGGE